MSWDVMRYDAMRCDGDVHISPCMPMHVFSCRHVSGQEFVTSTDASFLDRLISLISTPLLHLGACARFARVDWDRIVYAHYSKEESDTVQRSAALNSMALALDHLVKQHLNIREARVPIVDLQTPADHKPS